MNGDIKLLIIKKKVFENKLFSVLYNARNVQVVDYH